VNTKVDDEKSPQHIVPDVDGLVIAEAASGGNVLRRVIFSLKLTILS